MAGIASRGPLRSGRGTVEQPCHVAVFETHTGDEWQQTEILVVTPLAVTGKMYGRTDVVVGEVQGFKPEPLKVSFYGISLVWKEGSAATALLGTLFGRHVLAILAAVLDAGPTCCAYGL